MSWTTGWKKWILVIAALLPLLGATFLAGAFAKKHCAWPFCRGYLERTVEEVSEEEPAATFGDGIKQIEVDSIETNLYKLSKRTFSLTGTDVDQTRGKTRWMTLEGREGGLSAFNNDNDVLVASREGALMHIREDLSYEMLPTQVPVPVEQFQESVDDKRSVDERRFGVKDIHLVEVESGAYRLYATYNNWYADEECHSLKLSRLQLTKSDRGVTVADSWDDVYEAAPCLRIKDPQQGGFGGHQSGGRIADLSDTELLVTVGDFEFDGYGVENLPQDPSSPYGKTILVDVESGASTIYTLGHRNPQGLHVDAEGQIWSTEHGPKGGDELNLLEEGNNYGWPDVTYGTQYGQFVWPPAEQKGSHEGYAQPIFAWVPSIGVSQLTSIQKDLFSSWNGDLLVGSMQVGNLYRVRINQGRIGLMEEIDLGWRVRDMVERADGAIVIKTDRNTLVVLEPSEGAATT